MTKHYCREATQDVKPVVELLARVSSSFTLLRWWMRFIMSRLKWWPLHMLRCSYCLRNAAEFLKGNNYHLCEGVCTFKYVYQAAHTTGWWLIVASLSPCMMVMALLLKDTQCENKNTYRLFLFCQWLNCTTDGCKNSQWHILYCTGIGGQEWQRD